MMRGAARTLAGETVHNGSPFIQHVEAVRTVQQNVFQRRSLNAPAAKPELRVEISDCHRDKNNRFGQPRSTLGNTHFHFASRTVCENNLLNHNRQQKKLYSCTCRMNRNTSKGHVRLTCSAFSCARVLTSVSESLLHENILQNIFAFQATANEVAKTPGAARLNHSFSVSVSGPDDPPFASKKIHRRIS